MVIDFLARKEYKWLSETQNSIKIAEITDRWIWNGGFKHLNEEKKPSTDVKHPFLEFGSISLKNPPVNTSS